MTEEARLKQKEIRKKFKLARVYLNDSQNALQSGGVRLATDGAYNVIELVMRAAILHKGERYQNAMVVSPKDLVYSLLKLETYLLILEVELKKG